MRVTVPFVRRLSIHEVAPFVPLDSSLGHPHSFHDVDDLDVLISNPDLPEVSLDARGEPYHSYLDEDGEEEEETGLVQGNGHGAVEQGSSGSLRVSFGAMGSSTSSSSSSSSSSSASGGGGVSTAPSSVPESTIAAKPPVQQFASSREKNYFMQQEKLQRIKGVATGFDAAASIQRETGAKRPRDDAPLLRQREKTVAALNHNLIASTHRNTKMDLTEAELR